MKKQFNTEGCLLCGADLVYSTSQKPMKCNICGSTYDSNASCNNLHFICDNCHKMGAIEFINTYCLNSSSVNPAEMASKIMHNPNVKMHGPEHHFLVPAVLITAFYNQTDNAEKIAGKLQVARKRAENILGGFCGFYGSCGACIGNGVFMSIILDSTPISKNEWKLSNLLTSESLHTVANHGGPRCCKRDTYLALETAVGFLKNNLDVELESSEIKCEFSHRNKECIETECPYYTADEKLKFSLNI